MRPRRRATRWTCVSTGRAGLPRLKRRTQAAVFGPTPSSARSQRRASASGIRSRWSSSSAPRSARTASRMRWMRGALISARPPLRIASATAAVGAVLTASQLGYCRLSEAKARSVLTSEVFCESTVAISSSSGGPLEHHLRGPYAASSRRWTSSIFATNLRSGGLCVCIDSNSRREAPALAEAPTRWTQTAGRGIIS